MENRTPIQEQTSIRIENEDSQTVLLRQAINTPINSSRSVGTDNTDLWTALERQMQKYQNDLVFLTLFLSMVGIYVYLKETFKFSVYRDYEDA